MKTKWVIYTLLAGFIPIIIRIITFLYVNKTGLGLLFDEIDFIILGLILNLSNIHELENKNDVNQNWKTKMIGVSQFKIILLSAILALGYISEAMKNENFNDLILKSCAIGISFVSLLVSYSIFDRLNKLYNEFH